MISFAYYAFSGCKPALHHNLIVELRSKLYETAFCRRIAPHHIDESPTFLYYECLLGHNGGIFTYIKEGVNLCKLTRKKHMVRIRHFRTHRERACLWAYLRLCEIHQALIWICAVVRQRNRDIRLPRPQRVTLSQNDVTFLAFKIVKRSHTEVNKHRVALYNGSQERLSARADKRAEVDKTFADVT